jgi:hypothetical protein
MKSFLFLFLSIFISFNQPVFAGSLPVADGLIVLSKNDDSGMKVSDLEIRLRVDTCIIPRLTGCVRRGENYTQWISIGEDGKFVMPAFRFSGRQTLVLVYVRDRATTELIGSGTFGTLHSMEEYRSRLKNLFLVHHPSVGSDIEYRIYSDQRYRSRYGE